MSFGDDTLDPAWEAQKWRDDLNKLQAENDRLRAALQKISDLPPRHDRDFEAAMIARAALVEY